MGIASVIVLAGEDDVSSDVRPSLVSVQPDGAPPIGNRRKRGGGGGRGERDEKVSYDSLVGWVPIAIPYGVEVDRRC